MAKPIKKGKSRYSSGFSSKQVIGILLGIIIFAAIAYGIYWFYQNGTPSTGVTNNSVSSIKNFISNTGLQSTGILILAVGGVLFAFIFNKK
jgi:hypothetical protein